MKTTLESDIHFECLNNILFIQLTVFQVGFEQVESDFLFLRKWQDPELFLQQIGFVLFI